MNNEMHTLDDLLRNLDETDRKIIARILERKRITQNVNELYREQLTFGNRVADLVALFGGSWTFIFLFLVLMSIWIIFNAKMSQAFDPYPFILLNLLLSCLAALQAPVIMMSQNRKAEKDRIEAHNDYEINLKAETEIMALHEKMDELQRRQWSELLTIQERQLDVLARLELHLQSFERRDRA